MPKIKTNRAAAKRFHFTKSGKVKVKRAKLRHILTSKSRNQKRKLGSPAMVSSANLGHVKRLLPNG